MSRVASNAVWHSLPGVVAAYQPVGAPDEMAARQNVGTWQRMLGNYTATPGVAPTWTPQTGWKGNGSSQYLKTGVIPTNGETNWSALVRYSDSSGGCMFGYRIAGGSGGHFHVYPNAGYRYYRHQGTAHLSPGMASGVIGIAGLNGYLNGTIDASITLGVAAAGTLEMYILAMNSDGSVIAYDSGRVYSFSIYSRTLFPAEMWLASRQMAYCDVNPAWNVWARRRQYWIAPSVASGFQAAWAARANTLLGGGVN